LARSSFTKAGLFHCLRQRLAHEEGSPNYKVKAEIVHKTSPPSE
jgi:hypothetical protein